MPQKTEMFKVFVSSPSDLARERQISKTAISSASRMLSHRGVRLEPWLWEDDTTSDFSAPAQQVIREQLGEYDFYIGLMGSTFGSPTGRFGSGTEEEFSDAMTAYENDSLKRVGFFFKEVSVDVSKLTSTTINQLAKIAEFRERVGKRGLYKNFPSDQRLTELLTEFLVRSFDGYDPSDAVKNNGSPNSASDTLTRPIVAGDFKRDTLSFVDKEISGGMAELALEDLWVDLDLKTVILRKDGGISDRVYDVALLVKDIKEGKSIHICGRDISGKTAVCSRLFSETYNSDMLPVLLSGRDLRSPNFERFLSRVNSAICNQYEQVSQADARKLDKKAIIPIIDDFDLSSISRKDALSLLSHVRSEFPSIVIVTSISFTFSILEDTSDVDVLGSFNRVEIQELGQRKRYRLIENWYKCTKSYDSEEEFRNDIEKARSEINRILVTHIVPRTPLIVLILLQAIDNNQVSDLATSGYVRYYKFLIDNTILKNLRLDEAELAYALMPRLAWEVYNSKSKEFSSSETEIVIDQFAERRAIKKASLYSVLERLRKIGMFERDKESYQFKHQYAYYFFLSDFLNKNEGEDGVQATLEAIGRGPWSKENAVILVFLSFHSNKPFIADSIITQLDSSYASAIRFDLDGERAASINRLILEAPKQVVDRNSTVSRRESRLDAQDRADPPIADVKEESERGPLGEMEGVFMGVEVIGHIMRNHYAHLDAEPKRKMFEAASGAILRCAGNFINMLAENIDLLLSYTIKASAHLKEEEDKKVLETFTRTLIFLLAVGFLYHCSKKLAQAVGDENLEITYNQAVANDETIAGKMLDVIIRLDCFQNFPFKNLSSIVGAVQGNHVAMACLQIAVSERLDMRPPAAYADFQKYCKIVGLEAVPRLLQRQRLGSTPEKPTTTSV